MRGDVIADRVDEIAFGVDGQKDSIKKSGGVSKSGLTCRATGCDSRSGFLGAVCVVFWIVCSDLRLPSSALLRTRSTL